MKQYRLALRGLLIAFNYLHTNFYLYNATVGDRFRFFFSPLTTHYESILSSWFPIKKNWDGPTWPCEVSLCLCVLKVLNWAPASLFGADQSGVRYMDTNWHQRHDTATIQSHGLLVSPRLPVCLPAWLTVCLSQSLTSYPNFLLLIRN